MLSHLSVGGRRLLQKLSTWWQQEPPKARVRKREELVGSLCKEQIDSQVSPSVYSQHHAISYPGRGGEVYSPNRVDREALETGILGTVMGRRETLHRTQELLIEDES